MLYTSTRDKSVKVTSAQAIAQGISKDGGLFVPESIPAISKEFVDSLVGLDYISRAEKVLSLYLTDSVSIDYGILRMNAVLYVYFAVLNNGAPRIFVACC